MLLRKIEILWNTYHVGQDEEKGESPIPFFFILYWVFQTSEKVKIWNLVWDSITTSFLLYFPKTFTLPYYILSYFSQNVPSYTLPLFSADGLASCFIKKPIAILLVSQERKKVKVIIGCQHRPSDGLYASTVSGCIIITILLNFSFFFFNRLLPTSLFFFTCVCFMPFLIPQSPIHPSVSMVTHLILGADCPNVPKLWYVYSSLDTFST